MRHSLQVLSLAFLLLFFLSCTQIVTAIAKPPTDPSPPTSPNLLWLHFVAVCFAWALGGKFQYGSNTQQAYQMQCRAAPGKPQQHSKCPSAHALQYTLFLFPCCSSSSSSTAACNARNLSSTISVCGFCWDSLLICPANVTPSPRAASVCVSFSIYKIVLMPD